MGVKCYQTGGKLVKHATHAGTAQLSIPQAIASYLSERMLISKNNISFNEIWSYAERQRSVDCTKTSRTSIY